MKRLLCILSSMNSGGAETFLMKVYRKLDRSKYQMDFCINVRDKCYYEDEIVELGGRIFRIPSKSENLKQFKRGLYNIVKSEQYDYVLRITSTAMGFMDLKVAKKAGAEICSARSSNSSDGTSLIAKLAHRIGRVLYGRYVDVKFAPSDLAAKYTFGDKAYKNGDVTILPNAVDLSVYRFDSSSREKIRDEFSIDKEKTVIGHIGRFQTQKNHEFLIDVFDKIHAINPNTILLLVGTGELESKVKDKVDLLGLTDSVVFAGVRPDIPSVLSAMDVFVMPSFFEGMPNTVIEAQATGLPCVIADTITREANITGLVEYLPLGDQQMWAEKALAAGREQRADTKQTFIDNKYDIESTVNEFVKLVFGE